AERPVRDRPGEDLGNSDTRRSDSATDCPNQPALRTSLLAPANSGRGQRRHRLPPHPPRLANERNRVEQPVPRADQQQGVRVQVTDRQNDDGERREVATTTTMMMKKLGKSVGRMAPRARHGFLQEFYTKPRPRAGVTMMM